MWDSRDTTIATVSATGLVTAGLVLRADVAKVTISATVDGISADVVLTIQPLSPGGITVEPDTVVLKSGAAVRLTAVVRDSAGTRLVDRAVTWRSSDERIAAVAPDGTVSAVAYDGFEFKRTRVTASVGLYTASVEVSVVPRESFTGYRVAPDARAQGSSYWDNTPVPVDLVLRVFQTRTKSAPNQYSGWAGAATAGDFNADGYLDVFTAGSACNGMQSRPSFLLWNSRTLRFDESNLFTDGTDFLGGPMGIAAAFLNADAYVDLIIFGHADECAVQTLPNEPVRVAISNGKGAYDLISLALEPEALHARFPFENGAVGDVTGDGLNDLLVFANSHVWIFAGIPASPYFSLRPSAHFASDTVNFPDATNGFGERLRAAAEFAFGGRILDADGDGLHDLVIFTSEDDRAGRSQRIFYNAGSGRFTASKMQQLPFYIQPDGTAASIGAPQLMDVRAVDVDGDGLLDLVGVNQEGYKRWNLVAYLRQATGSYRLAPETVIHMGAADTRRQYKLRSFLHDLDGDGAKDIGYQSMGISCENFSSMSAFLRRGPTYLETPIGAIDPFAKWLITRVQWSPC
jgi:hypothetical protein